MHKKCRTYCKIVFNGAHVDTCQPEDIIRFLFFYSTLIAKICINYVLGTEIS